MPDKHNESYRGRPTASSQKEDIFKRMDQGESVASIAKSIGVTKSRIHQLRSNKRKRDQRKIEVQEIHARIQADEERRFRECKERYFSNIALRS